MSVSTIIKSRQKTYSKNIRLYLIINKKHYFINNGTIKPGFSNILEIKKSRTNIIHNFSKMGFLFDELIRLRIVGYHNNTASKNLLYILNLVPINRKIRTFLDWKVFDSKFTKKMSRLFEVRNDVLHNVSINEINYNPKNSISLTSKTGFKKFKNDFEHSWRDLIKIYLLEQNKLNFDNLSKDLLL